MHVVPKYENWNECKIFSSGKKQKNKKTKNKTTNQTKKQSAYIEAYEKMILCLT